MYTVYMWYVHVHVVISNNNTVLICIIRTHVFRDDREQRGIVARLRPPSCGFSRPIIHGNITLQRAGLVQLGRVG